jgi:hypothetical protein
MSDFDRKLDKIKIDPMVDYDITFTYTSTDLTGIVITGGGKTKTLVLTYVGGVLMSIATTIT